MRLTSFTDYSLRVLTYLAAHPHRRATIAEIARVHRISENHLTKVVQFLGKNGWVATARGRGGGLMLAELPAHIVVGAVVRAAEGGDLPAECFDAANNTCVVVQACRLRHALSDAMAAFHTALDRYTLASLVPLAGAPAAIALRRPNTIPGGPNGHDDSDC